MGVSPGGGLLTGTARLRRANADLLHARMVRQPSASAIRPGGSTSLRPFGPRAGQRPALQAIPVIRQDCIYTATGVEIGGPGRFGAGEGASGEQVRIESPPEHSR